MNLTVIGLNTVISFFPFLGGGTASAAAGELSWLDSTLASAQARGKKVWLLVHVPPGANVLETASDADPDGYITAATTTMMWVPDYQTSFLQVLSIFRAS